MIRILFTKYYSAACGGNRTSTDHALDSAAKVGKYSSFIWSRIKETYGSFQTCGICGDWIRRVRAKGDLAGLQA
jgi:hypothetical protein